MCAGRRSVVDGLDEPAEQARADEPGDRREGVQRDHARERAAVPPQRARARLHAHLLRRPRSAGARSLVLPARDRLAVGGGACEQLAVRSCGDDAPVGEEEDAVGLVEDERAGVDDDGRPAGRASRRRRAMRASVCASTALVGSTSTRISGSTSSARASASRWRWPPENDRPRSSTCASSPSGSASSTSSAFAVAIARAASASPSVGPHGSSCCRREPEKSIGSVSLTTIRRRTVASGRSTSRHAAERDVAVVDEAAEPVGERRRLGRVGGDDARQQRPAPTTDARALVDERHTRRAARRGVCRLGDRRARRRARRASACAPTNERVILSTASAAVRSGMTRKAA